MADSRPQDMDELLSEIEREWQALWGVVQRLAPAQVEAPDAGGWSPKDNLAHLAEWMKVLMGYHMDKRPAHEVMGVSIEITKDWDFDVINPVLLERNRQKAFPDVKKELEGIYAELTAKLRATPFEELMRPHRVVDGESRPLLDWVLGDTSEHFAEHRATIEKLL